VSTTQHPSVGSESTDNGQLAAAPTTPDSTEPAPLRARRRRRRGRRLVAVGTAVAVVGAGVGYAVTRPGSSSAKKTDYSNGSATALAAVAQGKISSRIPVDGTLGYAGSYKVINEASGVFTRLPRVGQVLKTGKPMYWVSGKPVLLLKGSTPTYRTLQKGLKGADVKELNAALVNLGYASKDDLDPTSNYFSSATRTAVKKLQKDYSLSKTGTVGRDLAVFLPLDELRVTSVSATSAVTAATDMSVFSASSTDRQVSVSLDASNQGQVHVGDKVTITLPNLKTTQGVVTSVGQVASKDDNGNLVVNVSIRPLDKKATGTLDKAPVQVSIVTDTQDNVLAVPVNALLALANGGYAVEIVGAGGVHSLVPVTLGIFDNQAGTVAVTGNGLTAGQKVVVPSS